MTTLARRIGTALIDGLRDLWRQPQGQIRALDGLRSLAVMLVIATHAGRAFQDAGLGNTVLLRLPVVTKGWVGVDLFFILSGFFIGRQLFRELVSTGSVAVGRFVLKRGLRIWPLYFTILAFLVIVLGLRPADGSSVWPDAVFVSNYLGERIMAGGWSLASEEQFYLLAPALLWALGRLTTNLRVYAWGLAGLLGLEALVRQLAWWQAAGLDHHAADLSIYYGLHTHCDGLLVGLLLAVLHTEPTFRAWLARRRVWVTIPVAAVLAGLLTTVARDAFNFTGLALVFGSLAATCLFAPPRWVRLLEARPFYLLGRLSFGMYLIHPHLMPTLAAGVGRLGLAPTPAFTLLFTAGVAASAAVATGTYLLVERPCLRLRDRWLAHAAPGAAPGPTVVLSGAAGGHDA